MDSRTRMRAIDKMRTRRPLRLEPDMELESGTRSYLAGGTLDSKGVVIADGDLVRLTCDARGPEDWARAGSEGVVVGVDNSWDSVIVRGADGGRRFEVDVSGDCLELVDRSGRRAARRGQKRRAA